MTYGTDQPRGLVPVMYKTGAPYTGMVREYPIADAYATAIYTGDPVISLADGTIGIGVAGSVCRGVFMGVKYQGTDGIWYHRPYWPASTDTMGTSTARALIADDPNLVFSIQETNASGDAGTALALADRGLNANFVIAAGSTTTGITGSSLNNASELTTSTLNLKIMDLDPYPGNVVGSFANWLVCWNTHELMGVGTTGV